MFHVKRTVSQVKGHLKKTLENYGKKETSTHPFKMNKARLLQECKETFAEVPVDHDNCCRLMTSLLYLMCSGEIFTEDELTGLFFQVTRLFQSKNLRLRRMVYLTISQLACAIPHATLFIATQSLMKDINSSSHCQRANALRVLSRVIDAPMLMQIERYIRTSILDKNAYVASSGLFCGLGLLRVSPDTVKRWVSEITEATESKHSIVQYHALYLLRQVKSGERMGLLKTLLNLISHKSWGSCSHALLVRMVTTYMFEASDQNPELIRFIENSVRHENDIVAHETCRALFKTAAIEDNGRQNTSMAVMHGQLSLLPALQLLQVQMSSSRPVTRFAAVRALNQLASHRPTLVSNCNSQLDDLLLDANRNIATLALTTLLKTGSEKSVDRLMRSISQFMTDVGETYKLDVVHAIKAMGARYPSKSKIILEFLASSLRQDGSALLKTTLVEAIIGLANEIPSAQQDSLLHLCEYIEDCESDQLCVQILLFLGQRIPQATHPEKYVRFLYNRVILEAPRVRAAAVDALARCGMQCDSLSQDILTVMKCAKQDGEDEVRQRIILYSTALEHNKLADLLEPPFPYSVDHLMETLEVSIEEGTPFQLEGVLLKNEYTGQKKSKEETNEVEIAPVSSSTEAVRSIMAEVVPDLGPSLRVTPPELLTDKEAEYPVEVIKHIFGHHIVLEFRMTNTIPGQVLENIEAELSMPSCGLLELAALTIPDLHSNEQKSSYSIFESGPDLSTAPETAKIKITFKFMVKDEGDDIGYSDEYEVQSFGIDARDYLQGQVVSGFMQVWETLPGEQTIYSDLTDVKNFGQATELLSSRLGMMVCPVQEESRASYKFQNLYLSGKYLNQHLVLVRAKMGFDQNTNVFKVQIKARSQLTPVVEALLKSF